MNDVSPPSVPASIQNLYDLCQKEQFAKGLELARTLITEYPFYIDVWLQYGRLLYLASENSSPEEIEQSFLRALELSPRNPLVLEELAFHYHSFGRRVDAVKYAAQYIEAVEPVLAEMNKIVASGVDE